MQSIGPTSLLRLLKLLAGVLVLKVTVAVVMVYPNYFPPNFDSEFLHGREAYFFGGYQWAFYAHVIAGPITLVLGLVLVSERFRRWSPRWHRWLGKVQVGMVVFLLAPSGLWMAYYAEGGAVAAVGFAVLAVLTATCAVNGWRLAVRRRFAEHRLWMWRCFLLLCSAVVLRLIGGLAMVTGVGGEWSYPVAAWASWLVPLTSYELGRRIGQRIGMANVIESGASFKTAG